MRSLCSLLLLAGLAGATSAHAEPFGPKSSRETMPAREVERPLDLPRGWSEFELSHDYKMGTGAWSPDGDVVPFEDAQWNYHTTNLRWTYGLARRADIQWDIPFITGNLKNDKLGTNITGISLGDIRFRYRYRLYESEAPLTSVIAEAEIKGPTGRETPGSYQGGPNQISTFVTSTGTWDLYLGAAAKRQVGPLAFVGRLGYQRRFSGLAGFLVETEQNQFLGRLKPGDRIIAELEATGQVGPVSLTLSPRFRNRAATKTGVTAKNWFNPGADLVKTEGSGGNELDVGARLTVNVTRGFDLHLRGNLPLMGQDLQFFPLEDIHPTYGPTFGGAVEVRF
ncbi:MAG: hypothetical protein AB8H79_01105 [Myxococcota bacterium]